MLASADICLVTAQAPDSSEAARWYSAAGLGVRRSRPGPCIEVPEPEYVCLFGPFKLTGKKVLIQNRSESLTLVVSIQSLFGDSKSGVVPLLRVCGVQEFFYVMATKAACNNCSKVCCSHRSPE